MKKTRWTHGVLWGLMAGACLLPGCSGGEDGPKALEERGVVKIRAVVDDGSRASDTDWETSDKIGVSNDRDLVNKAFVTKKGDGNFESADGDAVKITGSSKVTFSAFYPYNQAVTENNKTIPVHVADSQGAYTSNPSEVNLMAAEPVQADVDNPEVLLHFRHKMTKVALKFVDQSGLLNTENCEITYTLENVATSGNFDTEAGVVTASQDKASVKAPTTKLNTLSGVFLPPVSGGNRDEVTIRVEVKQKSNIRSRADITDTYTAKVTPALVEDTQYNYTLTFKYGDDMDVSTSTITGMTTADGDTTMKGDGDTPGTGTGTGTGTGQGGTSGTIGSTDWSQAQVGDYLLADGSYLPNATTFTDDTKAQVRAIIYYLPSTDAEKATLTSNGYPYTNGLAIATQVVNTRTFSDNTAYSGCFFSSRVGGSVTFGDVLDVYDNEGLKDPSTEGDNLPNSLFGWNNTKIWRLVANSSNTTWKKAGNWAIRAVDEYASVAPFDATATVSGWYLPSNGEMNKVTANISLISRAATAVGGKVDSTHNNTISQADTFYWTSDSQDPTHQWCSNLDQDVFTVKVIRHPASSSSDGYRGMFLLSVNF